MSYPHKEKTICNACGNVAEGHIEIEARVFLEGQYHDNSIILCDDCFSALTWLIRDKRSDVIKARKRLAELEDEQIELSNMLKDVRKMRAELCWMKQEVE